MTTFCIQHLDVGFGSKTLIHDLNIDFKAGQIFGILGENGIGKTSLLHTLAGLQKPQQGSILLNHQALEHFTPKKRAQWIGLLLQDADWSFPNTVLEIAESGLYPYQQGLYRQTETLERMHSILATFQLDTLIYRNVQTLSGGEKQRLRLATLIIQNPEIYLLDEPINHLDLKHRLLILDRFKALAQDHGKIVIITLHETELINRFCDQVTVIE